MGPVQPPARNSGSSPATGPKQWAQSSHWPETMGPVQSLVQNDGSDEGGTIL
jgi:hypothetical protein